MYLLPKKQTNDIHTLTQDDTTHNTRARKTTFSPRETHGSPHTKHIANTQQHLTHTHTGKEGGRCFDEYDRGRTTRSTKQTNITSKDNHRRLCVYVSVCVTGNEKQRKKIHNKMFKTKSICDERGALKDHFRKKSSGASPWYFAWS